CRWRAANVESSSRVGERQGTYDGTTPAALARVESKRTLKAATPYESSTRWYRGRIVDVLREVPAGAWLRIEELPPRIANGSALRPNVDVWALVDALARDGLLVVRVNGGGSAAEVALPD